MNKFWKWKKQKVINQDGGEGVERVLELRGTIASESWYDDDVTPKMFKDELLSGSGDITVYINSPGGDCVAAAQIYNMLSDTELALTTEAAGTLLNSGRCPTLGAFSSGS